MECWNYSLQAYQKVTSSQSFMRSALIIGLFSRAVQLVPARIFPGRKEVRVKE